MVVIAMDQAEFVLRAQNLCRLLQLSPLERAVYVERYCAGDLFSADLERLAALCAALTIRAKGTVSYHGAAEGRPPA